MLVSPRTNFPSLQTCVFVCFFPRLLATFFLYFTSKLYCMWFGRNEKFCYFTRFLKFCPSRVSRVGIHALVLRLTKGEVRYFVTFQYGKKSSILFRPLFTAKSPLPQRRAKTPFDWSPKGAWTEQQRIISQETGNCACFRKTFGLLSGIHPSEKWLGRKAEETAVGCSRKIVVFLRFTPDWI